MDRFTLSEERKGGMEKGAVLSECRGYRFALWRVWDRSLGYAMFIGRAWLVVEV